MLAALGQPGLPQALAADYAPPPAQQQGQQQQQQQFGTDSKAAPAVKGGSSSYKLPEGNQVSQHPLDSLQECCMLAGTCMQVSIVARRAAYGSYMFGWS